MLNQFGFRFVLQAGDDFPPVYPALLALGGVPTGDPAVAARWLNAFFFACSIVWVAWIIKQILPRSFWAPLIGAAFMLFSVTMLIIHVMAWSEPAFLFFALIGMIALASYIQHGQIWRLVAAGIAMGLAAMDRYVGIALAFTGVSALILLTPGSLRRKLGSAILFAALAYLPLAAWMHEHPTRRILTFRLPPPGYFADGYHVFSTWIVPAGNALLVSARLWIIAGLALFLASGVLFAYRRASRAAQLRVLLDRIHPLFYIVALFLVLYPLAHLTAKTFFSPSITLHDRALSPVFVVGLVVFICAAAFVFSQTHPASKWLRVGVAVVALAVLFYNGNAARSYVERSHVQGLGYNSRDWQDSPIIARVRALPDDVLIYSNGSDAVYFMTGHKAFRLPDKVDKMNQVVNQTYLDDMAQVGKKLVDGHTMIVYIDRYPDRWFQPNEDDLRSVLPLRVVARESDGVILQ